VQECPDAKLELAASAVVGATMFMFGGDEGAPAPTYPTVTSKYSMLTDTWTSAAVAPTAAGSRTAYSGPTFGSAAAVGSRIFYVGSNVATAPAEYGINEVYETATDTWTTRTAAPINTAQGTLLAAKGNRLYTFSVKFPASLVATTMYDATTNVWTTRAPPRQCGQRRCP
jgi:hypothetical protein